MNSGRTVFIVVKAGLVAGFMILAQHAVKTGQPWGAAFDLAFAGYFTWSTFHILKKTDKQQ